MIILHFDLHVYINPKNDALLIEIENIREMMIKVAFEEGFTSSNTIRISKRLDLLLNKLKLAC